MQSICVFDLDGTLINSMPRFSAAMTSLLEEEGIPYGEDLIKRITPLGYRGTASYYVETMGMRDRVENIVARIEKKLYREYSENIRLKEGVRSFLEARKKEGARLFVLTASPHLVTDVCLARNGVYGLFERVWSVEDFGLTKSDTRIFAELARTLGAPAGEIHYFDDNPIAIENAKKAGLYTYGVLDIQSPQELEALKRYSDVFLTSFEEA